MAVGEAVERVDERAQAPVGEAVEVEHEAREVDVVVVRDLGRQRGGGLDVAGRADVGELLVEPGQLLRVGGASAGGRRDGRRRSGSSGSCGRSR